MDKNGDMWELAIAGGGTMALTSSMSISTIGSSAATVLGIVAPVGLAIIVTVAVVGIISVSVKLMKNKTDAESESKDRVTSPIGRRNTYNSRKKAKEAAKKAGGGKEPVNHPKGFHGNKRSHYHPNVNRNYRITPHAPSCHDHYYYPR